MVPKLEDEANVLITEKAPNKHTYIHRHEESHTRLHSQQHTAESFGFVGEYSAEGLKYLKTVKTYLQGKCTLLHGEA